MIKRVVDRVEDDFYARRTEVSRQNMVRAGAREFGIGNSGNEENGIEDVWSNLKRFKRILLGAGGVIYLK